MYISGKIKTIRVYCPLYSGMDVTCFSRNKKQVIRYIESKNMLCDFNCKRKIKLLQDDKRILTLKCMLMTIKHF